MLKPTILFSMAAAVAVTACSSDSTGAGDVLVVSVVEIDPPGAGLIVGGTQQLQATPKTASGITVPNRPVDWSSRDPDIATVSESGLVTAVSFGATEIVAQVDDVTGDVPVNVSPKPVAQVLVDPTSANLQVDQARQLDVTLKAADGSTLNNRIIEYVSDDPAIASVSNSGLVTGVSAGQTVIRVRSEGKEGISTFTISPKPVAQVLVDPTAATIQTGQSRQLTVTLKAADGSTLTGRTIQYLSDDANIASVSNSGLVTGVSPGETVIRVRSEGKEGTSTFTITPRPAVKLAFTQQPQDGAAGLALEPVRVALQDETGATVAGATNAVTISLEANPGDATLSGDLTVNAVNGVATFSDLSLNRPAAGYRLRAASGSLTPAVSATFTITSGPPASMVFVTRPSELACSGDPLPQQPVLQLMDSEGNQATTAGLEVTAQVSAGATLGGTNKIQSNAAGTVEFTNLSITGVGAFQLHFTAQGLAELSAPVGVILCGDTTGASR